MAFYNGLPLFGPHLKSNSRLAIHSPEEQKKLQGQYRDALGIGKNTTFSADAFDTLAKGSIRDVHLFKTTKGPGDVPIHDKLTGAAFKDPVAEKDKIEASQKVRDAIDTALTADPKFKKAQEDYNDSVATFRQLADQVPSKFKAIALIDLMTELKNDAIKAIEVQQKAEKKLLEEQFKNPDFRANLSKTLNLNSDADIDVVKTNMIADLEANQKKQLDEFKTSTTQSETTLHKAAAAEQKELLFMANLRENNPKMRKIIEQLAEDNRKKAEQEALAKGLPPPPALEVKIGASKNGMVLSGVTIAQLDVIKTLSGKYDIKPIKDQPGSFSMDFGRTLFNPGYYQDPRQNVKADFMLMAQAVRGCGFEKIKMEMDFEPEAVAMERARQAYEAAVESGFPPQAIPKDEKNPDKIVMLVKTKDGMKEMRADELFRGHETRLQITHGKATSIAKELKDLSTLPKGTVDLAPIKEEMNDLRVKNKAAKEAEVEENDETLDTGPTSLTV